MIGTVTHDDRTQSSPESAELSDYGDRTLGASESTRGTVTARPSRSLSPRPPDRAALPESLSQALA
eukprot:204109-Hanusia_phi.AAC.1